MEPVSTPSLRVCSRHPLIAAPRACSECSAPLCSACAKHKPHQACLKCSDGHVDAGAMWFATLMVDTLVQGRRAIPARAAAAGLSLIAVAIVSIVGAMSVLDERISGSVSLEIVGGALGFAAVLGFCLQPGAWAPLARPLSLWRTVARAFPLGAAVVVVSVLGFGLVGGAVAGLEALDAPLLLTIPVAILCALLMFAIWILALPWAWGLMGAAVFKDQGAWPRSLKPGWRTFGAVAAAHTCCAMLGYSIAALPMASLEHIHGMLGAIVLLVGGALSVVLTLILQGAFTGATWRFISDREAARRGRSQGTEATHGTH